MMITAELRIECEKLVESILASRNVAPEKSDPRHWPRIPIAMPRCCAALTIPIPTTIRDGSAALKPPPLEIVACDYRFHYR